MFARPGEPADLRLGKPRRDRVDERGLRIAAPVDGVLVADHAERGLIRIAALVERVAVALRELLDRVRRDDAGFGELAAVERAHARMLADRAVHHGLRRGRLVGLVVTEAPVGDEVDHDVLVEHLPVAQREPDRSDRGFRIVAVHVEHGRLDHLRDVGAVRRRAAVARIARREADLIVDHEVHGAARVERARLRELERLRDDALARECRVAVDQHGQHLLAERIAAPVLARAHRALDDRIHDLEVRRVERERDVHVAVGRAHVRRVAFVILHVARALEPREVVSALELGEQIFRGLAEHVDEHVEPAAVRHADHDFLHALLARPLNEVVEHRDQRLAALERETLLADEARVQVPLDAFRAREAVQDRRLLGGRELPMHAARLELLTEPEALASARDVRELGRELAAVDLLQQREDILQLHPLLAGAAETAGVELARQVRVVEAEEVERQHRGHGPVP